MNQRHFQFALPNTVKEYSVRLTEEELNAFINQWEKENDHFFDSAILEDCYP